MVYFPLDIEKKTIFEHIVHTKLNIWSGFDLNMLLFEKKMNEKNVKKFFAIRVLFDMFKPIF